jgi:hypothetical protein
MDTDAETLRRALWSVLFMGGAMYALDVYSAVNSSPWAASQAAADPVKEASLRKYIRHGMVAGLAFGGLSSVISRQWWPLVGAGATTAYMMWLYEDAIKYAKVNSNSKGFRWNN